MSRLSKQNTAKIKNGAPAKASMPSVHRTVIMYFFFLMVFWTGALYLLAKVELKRIDSQIENFAINKTHSLLEKDITYYQWVGSQNDIYFVKTQQESNGSSSSGADATNQRIELMQFTADALLGLSQNIWAKNTGSIIAIYTDFNQAQEQGQLDALKVIFDGSAKATSSIRKNNQKEYINVMLPLEYSSAEQGAKVTKVISLLYPLQEFIDLTGKDKTIVTAKYMTAWLLGLGLLFIMMIGLFASMRKWSKRVAEQLLKVDELQSVVNQRTQDIIQLQRNLQNVIDQMPLPAYIKNKENLFIAVNQTFADILGCGKDKLINSTGAGYLPPELADYFYQFESMVFNSGEKIQVDSFKFERHGEFNGVMFPISGNYGQIEGVSVILTPLEKYVEHSPAQPLSTMEQYQSPAEPAMDNERALDLSLFDSVTDAYANDRNTINEDSNYRESWLTHESDANAVSEAPLNNQSLLTEQDHAAVVELDKQTPTEINTAEAELFNATMEQNASDSNDDDFSNQPYAPLVSDSKFIDYGSHTSFGLKTSSSQTEKNSGITTTPVNRVSGNLFETLQVRENGAGPANPVHIEALHSVSSEPIPEMAPQFVESIVDPQPETLVEESITPSSMQLNMLLVDDDRDELTLLSDSLAKLGHKVKAFDNATSAIECLANERFDVLFMDIQMPVMNGIQATAVIRKHERQKQINRMPIIAITTHAEPGDKDKYKVCGMDNYTIVSSPITQLADLIEETIIEFNLTA